MSVANDDKFSHTLQEYFEFCALLMDDGNHSGFFEIDGSGIRSTIPIAMAFSKSILLDKFIDSHEFWLDAKDKNLSFFDKDFKDLIKDTNLDLNVLKSPINKYIDFKNGKISSCPFTDEDIDIMWQYLHALIKHAHCHVSTNKLKYPTYPYDLVAKSFGI